MHGILFDNWKSILLVKVQAKAARNRMTVMEFIILIEISTKTSSDNEECLTRNGNNKTNFLVYYSIPNKVPINIKSN